MMMTDAKRRKIFQAKMLADQQYGKESLWFISQADGDPKNTRGCYIWARGYTSATVIKNNLGLLVPGSSAEITEVDYLPPAHKIGILLTKEEIAAIENSNPPPIS